MRGSSTSERERAALTSPTPTSSPSTELAQANIVTDANQLDARASTGSLTRVSAPSAKDTQVAQLQVDLVSEKDARRQERFGWFAACGLLFMVLSFMAAGGICGSIVALVYLALLLVFSKMWGIEGVTEALHTAREFIPGAKKDEDKTE